MSNKTRIAPQIVLERDAIGRTGTYIDVEIEEIKSSNLSERANETSKKQNFGELNKLLFEKGVPDKQKLLECRFWEPSNVGHHPTEVRTHWGQTPKYKSGDNNFNYNNSNNNNNSDNYNGNNNSHRQRLKFKRASTLGEIDQQFITQLSTCEPCENAFSKNAEWWKLIDFEAAAYSSPESGTLKICVDAIQKLSQKSELVSEEVNGLLSELYMCCTHILSHVREDAESVNETLMGVCQSLERTHTHKMQTNCLKYVQFATQKRDVCDMITKVAEDQKETLRRLIQSETKMIHPKHHFEDYRWGVNERVPYKAESKILRRFMLIECVRHEKFCMKWDAVDLKESRLVTLWVTSFPCKSQMEETYAKVKALIHKSANHNYGTTSALIVPTEILVLDTYCISLGNVNDYGYALVYDHIPQQTLDTYMNQNGCIMCVYQMRIWIKNILECLNEWKGNLQLMCAQFSSSNIFMFNNFTNARLCALTPNDLLRTAWSLDSMKSYDTQEMDEWIDTTTSSAISYLKFAMKPAVVSETMKARFENLTQRVPFKKLQDFLRDPFFEDC